MLEIHGAKPIILELGSTTILNGRQQTKLWSLIISKMMLFKRKMVTLLFQQVNWLIMSVLMELILLKIESDTIIKDMIMRMPLFNHQLLNIKHLKLDHHQLMVISMHQLICIQMQLFHRIVSLHLNCLLLIWKCGR